VRTRARSRRQADVTVPAEGDIFPSGFRVDAILAYGLGPDAPSLDPMFRQTPDEPETISSGDSGETRTVAATA
jgi:hypothetical protein